MERRNTVQKDLVYNAVLSMRRHVTAEEIYSYISQDHPSIGRGTVYRNLGILVEEGKVRKVEIPGGPDRFDFTLTRHYHVRCIRCSSVADVELSEMPDIAVTDSHGFDITDYDILFKGICPECRRKEQETA